MSTACFFGRVYNEEALKKIGELGVKDAEVFFSARMEYGKPFVAELKKIRDGEGIRIRAVHALPTQFEPQLLSGHMRQYGEALEIFETVLAAGRELGAELYVFHGPMHLKVAKKLEFDFAFAGERMVMLAEKAREYGLMLCYENVHWCWYKIPGFAKKMLEYCPSDNLYFTLDMKQAAQSGHSLFEYIEDMGERLKHIHVCDYNTVPGKGIIPCLPFRGETDWQGLRARLQSIGYGGMLMLEVYARDYDTYEELYENYCEVKRFFE